MDDSCEFRVLGPLEAARGGAVVTLAGARQRSLLAVLLVHANEVVSSDRLIDELWGEEPPQTAATALHGVVSQLRKTLQPGRRTGDGTLLVTHAPGYVLRVDPRLVDFVRFEQLLVDGRGALDSGDAGRAAGLLREALALWRGRAFDGADDAPSAHAEAMRLEDLRLEALETRIDADLALGRDDELVPELEALVAHEPLREKLQAQLMLALYRAGRQAEALQRYQNFRAMLRDRLGIEPSPRLKELEQAVLRQDPELHEGMPRVRPRRALRRRRRAVAIVVSFGVLLLAATASVLVLTRPDAPLQGAPGSVAVVDPEVGRVVDTIEVGSGPSAIVHGHGAIWVANAEDETVSRIDPSTRDVVRVIGVDSPVDLAVGSDAIWVAGGIDGTVSRIDPESSDVVAEIDLGGPDRVATRTVQGVAADERAAWAAVGDDLVRIDPASNRPVGFTDVGDAALAVTVGHGSVWVVTGAQRLLRFEPRSQTLTATTPIGGYPTDVESTDDGIVVLAIRPDFSRADIWLFDADSAGLTQTLASAGDASGVADVPGPGLWVVSYDGSARFVDPASDEPRALSTGGQPSSVAVGEGRVWVAIGEPEL